MSGWEELNAALDQGKDIMELLNVHKDIPQQAKKDVAPECAGRTPQEFWSNLQVNGLDDEPMQFVLIRQRLPTHQALGMSNELMPSQLCFPIRTISKPCYIQSS